MADKGENLLYSLLPLILIIAVSWFFSFINSRARKATDETAQKGQPQAERDLMQLFIDEDDGIASRKPVQRPQEHAVPGADAGITLWQPQAPEKQVTPKPIEPKWWGA